MVNVPLMQHQHVKSAAIAGQHELRAKKAGPAAETGLMAICWLLMIVVLAIGSVFLAIGYAADTSRRRLS